MIRKICVCVLFICWIGTVSGCGDSNGEAGDVKEENVRTKDRNEIQYMQTYLIPNGAEEITQYNPYFFEEDRVALTARAVYDQDPRVEQTIRLNLYKVHVYECGVLYKLAVELVNSVGYLTEDRLNIYLYVTEDKIYRLWSGTYQDGRMITFYDDDALLVSVLDTDEKLIANSEIVCQMENISVDVEDGEGRDRYSIYRKDDLITYSRSDVQPNGVRGFYEWFIWKDGEGLIEYGSGFKLEADILYLYDISVDAEAVIRELKKKSKESPWKNAN